MKRARGSQAEEKVTTNLRICKRGSRKRKLNQFDHELCVLADRSRVNLWSRVHNSGHTARKKWSPQTREGVPQVPKALMTFDPRGPMAFLSEALRNRTFAFHAESASVPTACVTGGKSQISSRGGGPRA